MPDGQTDGQRATLYAVGRIMTMFCANSLCVTQSMNWHCDRPTPTVHIGWL